MSKELCEIAVICPGYNLRQQPTYSPLGKFSAARELTGKLKPTDTASREIHRRYNITEGYYYYIVLGGLVIMEHVAPPIIIMIDGDNI